MAATSVDTSCRVTNNAGTPVVVLDAYTSATNVATNSPKKGYQQSLKILPLAEGGDVIADGATGTVTLNDTRTDSHGQTQPNYLYQLLVSRPQSLFPVMDAGEAISFKTTPMSYPPIAVTSAAAKNMTLAHTFCQNLMAFPTSNLAKNFQQALVDAQKQSSVDAMLKAIAGYFNTTTGFKGLDFPSYVAVSSYIQAFGWVWGLDDSGNPGRTYWLYASSDAGQQPPSTAASAGNASPNHGSITFSLKGNAPNPADPTDPTSGYTITYTPTSGNAVTLTFDGGQVLDNPDTPSICLQGTYALKSAFTHADGDNVAWPILVGTLEGTKVIGVSQPPESWWQKNVTSKTFSQWVDLFLKGMGLWMAFDFLKNKLAGKEDKLKDDEVNENNGQPPDQNQVEQADSDAESIEEESLVDNRGRFGRLGDDESLVPDEDDLADFIDQVNQNTIDTLNDLQGDQYDAMIDEYEGQLEALAEIEVNPALEDAMNALTEAKSNMDAARESGDYSSIKESLGDVKGSIGEAVQQMDIPQELQEQLEASQEAIDDYQDFADEIDDTTGDIADGEDPIEPEVVEAAD